MLRTDNCVRNIFLVVMFSVCLFNAAPLLCQIQVLYAFTGCGTTNDGCYPSGIIRDSSGNLYGTTYEGGSGGSGTVFELSRGNGDVWVETILYNFFGLTDGGQPLDRLTIDGSGNLYGTTSVGGEYGYGTVFELNEGPDGLWTETVLHSFNHDGVDGGSPYAGVILDQAGNLYGTTVSGGANVNNFCTFGCGIVYELSPSPTNQWTETILHNFGSSDTDGMAPYSGLTLDVDGNIYGTTFTGGRHTCNYGGEDLGCGTVFELSLGMNGEWTEFSASFDGSNGSFPYGTPVLDELGNVYGTTTLGGKSESCNCGTVFQLVREGANWKPTVLHSFDGYNGKDGASPWSGLTLDGSGNIYGTTAYGGLFQYGTVFELTKGANGRGAKKTLSFNYLHGMWPRGSVVLDGAGNVYGSTYAAGSGARGLIFMVSR